MTHVTTEHVLILRTMEIAAVATSVMALKLAMPPTTARLARLPPKMKAAAVGSAAVAPVQSLLAQMPEIATTVTHAQMTPASVLAHAVQLARTRISPTRHPASVASAAVAPVHREKVRALSAMISISHAPLTVIAVKT